VKQNKQHSTASTWRRPHRVQHTTMWFKLKLKLKLIYYRRSVGQSVLVSGSHLEPMNRFLFSIWRLRVSWCGAPSLTRGRVCNLLYNCYWALPEQPLLGRSPANSRPYFTVSSETLPTWVPGPRIYILQEQSVPVIPPHRRLLRLAGLNKHR
jgi:hypothetical protein